MHRRLLPFQALCGAAIVAFAGLSYLLAKDADSAKARGDTSSALLQIGHQKQLFVDNHIISEQTGLTRELGHVEKASGGKPIFDGWFYGTVLRDEGRFKMWHRLPGGKGYGYAESSDGLRFEEKASVEGINYAGDHTLAVELDRVRPGQKHRFLGGYDAPGMRAGIAVSPDGIHWQPLNDGKPVTYRAADCYNQVLWDESEKLYRLVTRTDFGTGGGPLEHTVAKDFEVRGARTMTNPDLHADPLKWTTVREWWFNREGKNEYRRRQIYAMTMWIYEGVYFALMSVYEYPADVSEGTTNDYGRRHERDIMNFYMATSRDADSWDLRWVYAGQPLIPRGPDNAFDKDIVLPASTVVTHADRHWLYYGGANERHGTEELKPPVHFNRDTHIGLATLRLDGFVALTAQDAAGTITTKPFRFDGEALAVNVDASRGGVKLEVLDDGGQPIKGFAGPDAVETTVDELRWAGKWDSGTRLASLKGRTVRLRFTLRNARLYAFQVLVGRAP